jgi:tRNA-specific 2-thiouridylase
VTLDLREAFRTTVVDHFVAGYGSGTTPNPCMRCNGVFRFDVLVAFARRIGAGALWTGHYARTIERDGVRLVARGADRRKDQSYMLATVHPALLRHVGFPLGGDTKDAVRAEARSAGLAAAGRAESQEACFLAGDDYRSFLERQGVVAEPGPVVDLDGNELGRHAGLWRFTPGQRRGIGVTADEPLYAVRADRARNALVVGPRRALRTTRVVVEGGLYVPVQRAEAQLRYRSPAVPVQVERTSSGFVLELGRAVEGVAPGQVAALYDAGAVVGAGEIVAATG